MKNQNGNKWWRQAALIAAVLVVYIYAVQATQINLEEPLKPRRQENLIGLIRELAHPDLFAFENETRSTNISIRMPCPEEIKGSQVTAEGRVATLAPNCATTTQDLLQLSGEGFKPNGRIVVFWHPVGSTSVRRLTDTKADAEGKFVTQFTMPDIRETADPQRIEIVEVIDRRIIGLSDTSNEALQKIVETVLMALLASTFGTLLAIPLSFIAARNLMESIKVPLAATMLAIILTPVLAGGSWILVSRLTTPLVNTDSGVLLSIKDSFLTFGFVGNFIYVLLFFLFLLLLPLLAALVGLIVAVVLGNRYGQEAMMRMSDGTARGVTAVLTFLGSAILFLLIALFISWLNVLGVSQFLPETTTGRVQMLLLPAGVVGAVGAILSLRRDPKRPFAIGFIIYTLTRGIFNAIRSIEPIMMAFVFVVWVGLGPFAGIMALTLHSLADLGKLFSEEVENIAEGPLEAITATGANFVQQISYAVIPQIFRQYIAYIFYRWDINVRMSTIIGFVGGGGIGFVLQRNINQTLYTKASVMVIAIAIVVGVLDYLSAQIRDRII